MTNAELKLLAEKATQGEWRTSRDSRLRSAQVVGSLDELICVVHYSITQVDPNGEYIAAANPSRVIALLDQIEEMRKTIEFYANGAKSESREEFGCGCCASSIKDGEKDYEISGSEIQGLTARETLARYKE